MAAAPVAKNWWSRSKSSPKHPKDKSPLQLTQSYPSLPLEFEKDRLADPSPKQSSKLNAFASVMGLKPKKYNIAIQDPPPTSSQSPYSPDSYTSNYSSRPLSNAVSLNTEDETYEPTTPSDSIMTISDPDPFASTGILGPHNIDGEDPNRLSVLSDASKYSEYGAQYRQSYASSSSNSHRPPRERLVSESSVSGLSTSFTTNLNAKSLMVRTLSETAVKGSAVSSHAFRPESREKEHAFAPRTTSEARRPMRPRGMTDVGTAPPRLRSNSNATPTPLVLVRQPSFSRTIVASPNNTPPPAQALPPVPFLDPSRSPAGTPPMVSSSSSPVSFASSFSDMEDNKSASFGNDKGTRGLREPVWAQDRARNTPLSQRTNVLDTALPIRTPGSPVEAHGFAKRMISQQALGQSSSTPSSPTVIDDWKEGLHLLSSSKLPKKQRSFHHPRIPIPPIPALRHASSFNPPDTAMETLYEREKLKEKEKRESAASLTRRRLFPGTMRRSPSNQTSNAGTDDDSGSMFSLSPDTERYATSFINPFASPGSESMILPPPSEPPNTPPPTMTEQRRPSETPSIDYVPQQIMSPADMLRLEATMPEEVVECSRSSSTSSKLVDGSIKTFGGSGATLSEFGLRSATRRPRGDSFADSVMSGSTTFSTGAFTDRLDTTSTNHQPTHFRGRADSGGPTALETFPARGWSTNTLSPTSMSGPTSLRPSTSQGTMNYHFVDLTQDSGDTGIISLPPPPRARPRTAQRTKHENAISARPPPSAHIVRRNTSGMSNRSAASTASSHSEPRSPPSSFGNGLPRRSIMKKPSFLDIEDEAEAEMGGLEPRRTVRNLRRIRSDDSLIEDSFLDLGRDHGSFDTVRSITESFS